MIAEFDIAAPIEVMIRKNMGPANEARCCNLPEKPFGISYACHRMARAAGKLPQRLFLAADQIDGLVAVEAHGKFMFRR